MTFAFFLKCNFKHNLTLFPVTTYQISKRYYPGRPNGGKFVDIIKNLFSAKYYNAAQLYKAFKMPQSIPIPRNEQYIEQSQMKLFKDMQEQKKVVQSLDGNIVTLDDSKVPQAKNLQTCHFEQQLEKSSNPKDTQQQLVEMYKEQAHSAIVFMDTLFTNTPPHLLQISTSIYKSVLLYKTMLYLRLNPHGMLMVQKKLLHVFIKTTQKKNLISVNKEEAFQIVQQTFPYAKNQLKYVLAGNEKTTYSAVYEIVAGVEFGKKQSSVHKIIYRTENIPTSIEEQNKSLLLTKQKNCDLSVEYTDVKTSTKIMSLLDVLIGVNKSFKGNLLFIPISATQDIMQHQTTLIKELKHFQQHSNALTRIEKNLLDTEIQKIEIITISNKTPAAKILEIQEIIIQNILLCRKINPAYNPNMITFIPTKPDILEQNIDLLNKITYEISVLGGLTSNTPDKIVSQIFEAIVPVYLQYKKPNLQVMSPEERQFCLSFIEKYAPSLIKLFTNI